MYLAHSRSAFAAAQSAADAAAVIIEAATTRRPRFRWQTSPGAAAFAVLSLADLDGSRVLGQTAAGSTPTDLVLASTLLALCNMRTLYLRNVPDDVAERLERLAQHDSMSVNAFAVRELAQLSRRADNQRLLDSLPDLGFSAR